MTNQQRTFNPEEIKEHLRARTWASLRADDRVERPGFRDVSVHSYLNRYGDWGHRTEWRQIARQIWDATYPNSLDAMRRRQRRASDHPAA
jgi:hypothetical protein